MQALTTVALFALSASPVLAQSSFSLLTDSEYPSSGTLNLRSTLQAVAARKGGPFHFGSTYDTYESDQSWFTTAFSTFFNHLVSENGCKWDATEPTQGTTDLTECKACQSFATNNGASFRGHNTFWHSQTPSWLPGSISATELVDTIIPQHVQAEIQGMGTNVTSWDVVNEVVGDGVSQGMTALQCVQNKGDWPTVTQDGGSTPLVKDLSFIHAAFTTALQYAGSNTRLAINDYNTGGNDAKTACVLAVLADINANANIPYNRLSVGFQSHISASTGGFTPKAQLEATFAKLNALGATAMITELDVSDPSDNARYQAAIWGDYLDACLYAPNCNEFINWDGRDDLSWLGASNYPNLFDSSGNPKLAAYEVSARLQRYASGATELCATALGSSQCTVPAKGTGTTTSAPGSPSTHTSTSTSATTAPTGATAAHYGQCGGTGWTGPTVCASPYTCQAVSPPYYSQCL